MKTLAISLSDRVIRMVEINEKREISFLDVIETPFSFSECFNIGAYDDIITNEAGMILCNALKDKNLTGTKIAVLLDTSEVFINIIPIDFSENSQSIHSSILWDLSNYFSDSYKNFKINYYPIDNEKHSESVYDTLIIAIDNNKLNVIKKIVHSCRLRLNVFDIDHFSAEKYFKEVYKNHILGKKCLVVGCKKNRFDVSIFSQDAMFFFDFINFRESGYQSKLNELLILLKSNPEIYQFDTVFLYGDDYSIDVYNLLTSNIKNMKIVYPDPLKDLDIHTRMKNSVVLQSDGYKFIPACGLALKN